MIKKNLILLTQFLTRPGLSLTCIFISILLSGTNCVDSDSAKADTKILFVGNSLTYTNNLPELVAKIGDAKANKIETTMLALPNYALEDHWNDGKLQQMIQKGGYDFVVLQQGPSSQEEGRVMLLDYGQRIQELCKANNAKLAFFMVWPALGNYYTFEGVIRNYTEAATKTESILCPVGKIWKEHFAATQDFSYYGNDQFHPSMEGSKSAAEIIYTTLFN
jgi:hypothetical protein